MTVSCQAICEHREKRKISIMNSVFITNVDVLFTIDFSVLIFFFFKKYHTKIFFFWLLKLCLYHITLGLALGRQDNNTPFMNQGKMSKYPGFINYPKDWTTAALRTTYKVCVLCSKWLHGGTMGWKPQIRALLNSVEQLTILHHVTLKSHSCQIRRNLSLSYACLTHPSCTDTSSSVEEFCPIRLLENGILWSILLCLVSSAQHFLAAFVYLLCPSIAHPFLPLSSRALYG